MGIIYRSLLLFLPAGRYVDKALLVGRFLSSFQAFVVQQVVSYSTLLLFFHIHSLDALRL